MKIFFIIIAIILIIAIVAAIVIVKYKNNEEINKTENTNPSEEQEQPVDVSNIVDTNVIEGASRDMEVLNDEDAIKILSEMYIKAINTYNYNFDTEENEDGTKITLVGYDEVMSSIFTNNGIKQFEEYYKEQLKKEGKSTYITDISLIKEELNYTFKITEKSIEGAKITSKIKSTYNGIEKIDQEFIIVRENDVWKVDSFVCPF